MATSRVEFAREEGLIRVHESGVLDAEAFARAVARLRDMHRETACRRVLVDAREQVSQTEGIEAYYRGKLAAQQLAGTAMRIAVVVSATLLDGHEFFETVSRNRGMQLKIFVDESAARDWLAD